MRKPRRDSDSHVFPSQDREGLWCPPFLTCLFTQAIGKENLAHKGNNVSMLGILFFLMLGILINSSSESLSPLKVRCLLVTLSQDSIGGR